MCSNLCRTPAYKRQRTVLVLFDFDLTLCDEDTYSVVIQMALLAGLTLPPHLQTPPEYEGWPEYMRGILEYFHVKKITADMIKERLQECPMTKGMQELLRYLHDHQEPSKFTAEEGDKNGVAPDTKTVYETVILSDANSCFIQWILEKHNLSHAFAKVLTNPSEVTADGRIKLGEFHEQTECKISPKNMCKGRVMEEWIAQKVKRTGSGYSAVYYVGDSMNDLCPAKRLGPTDIFFVRRGFSLHKKLAANDVLCKVELWSDGRDILKTLKALRHLKGENIQQ
ncbi:hypothetical protein RvY_12975 [Ramazzottius varieornatus]|uniref:Uncharacterized protein n=1 Tax=Ramazzottius varieornatus TaxID=947166 RepID=A0A1D1VTV2_RAMVA|nr:hypothetical protein RvY_12975 [Ramazzottius varieornatus]